MEALDGGLRELIVLGDRRFIDCEAGADGWPQAIARYLETMIQALGDRAQLAKSAAYFSSRTGGEPAGDDALPAC